MTNNTTLQADYDLLAERAKDKRAELTAAQAELKQLTFNLVDASDAKERKALIQKRADLTNLVGALDDELRELVHRRDAANLAIFEYAESEAKEKATAFDQKIHAARLALDALLNEQRILLNRDRGKMSEAEHDKKRLELNLSITKTKAENEILKRDANRAGVVLQRARNDADFFRKELENGI